ncbi:IPT/TIG domain-containing protein [bacterium]|nr:IPT/TIG domain-containing protein [bacterium]
MRKGWSGRQLLSIACAMLLLLSAGCFGAPSGAPPAVGGPGVGDRTVASLEPLTGMVDFGVRRAQAGMNDVAKGATVSLIDVVSGNTIATTLTTPTGGFSFSFARGWRPRTDVPYYLEAIKGLDNNLPGSDGVRVRTILVYRGAWLSLTNRTSTSGAIYITLETTAISVITAYHPYIDTRLLIGSIAHGQADNSVSPPTASSFDPAGSGITNEIFHQVTDLVNQAIADDSDPMFRIRYNPVFKLYTLSTGGSGGGSNRPQLQGLSSYVGGPGMTITLLGEGFGPNVADNAVSFNGTVATILSASPTELVVVVPPEATPGLVTVTTSLGTSNGIIFTVLTNLLGGFNPLLSPTLSSVAPLAVVPGATVSLTGTRFDVSPGANVVWMNGKATTASASTTTSLTFVVPAGWQSGPIQVTRGTAPSNPLYLAVGLPVVVAANIPSAPPGITITLAGLNFVPAMGANFVEFVGATAAPATASATSLTVTIPPGAQPGPVTVRTAAGPSLPFAFGVLTGTSGTVALGEAATVTAMAPVRGPVGLAVAITGTGFSTWLPGNIVRFNGIPATITSATATRLDVIVPEGATTGPVTVDVAAGRVVAGTFTVHGPAVTNPAVQGVPMLSGLSPTQGLPGTVVTVTGTNFDPIVANNHVSFNGVVAVPADGTSEQLTVTVPVGATAGNVTVTHSGGTSTAQPFFVIPGHSGQVAIASPPTVSAVTPGHARVGETVTLTGTNFWPILGANAVRFNGLSAPIATVSATSLVCAVPAGAKTGLLSVDTPSGRAVWGAFTVDPEPFVLSGDPVLVSLSRDSAPAGATLTLTGANFHPDPSRNTVEFVGATATPSAGGATSLTVIVPAGAGTGGVRVRTDAGLSDPRPFVMLSNIGGTFDP